MDKKINSLLGLGIVTAVAITTCIIIWFSEKSVVIKQPFQSINIWRNKITLNNFEFLEYYSHNWEANSSKIKILKDGFCSNSFIYQGMADEKNSRLTKEELKDLLTIINKANFFEFKDRYTEKFEGRINAGQSYITIKTNSSEKKVFTEGKIDGTDKIPDDFYKIEDYVLKLCNK